MSSDNNRDNRPFYSQTDRAGATTKQRSQEIPAVFRIIPGRMFSLNCIKVSKSN